MSHAVPRLDRPPPATAEAVALISELYAEEWTAPKKGGAARWW